MSSLYKFFYPLVWLVERVRAIFHCKTYHVEGAIVLAALTAVAYFTEKDYVEYIGIAAVFLGFMGATIAEYMREAEAKRAVALAPSDILVDCHRKLPYYFYAKEVCWFAYFYLLGAHSALVGVIVFILYQPWRQLWRYYHPA